MAPRLGTASAQYTGPSGLGTDERQAVIAQIRSGRKARTAARPMGYRWRPLIRVLVEPKARRNDLCIRLDKVSCGAGWGGSCDAAERRQKIACCHWQTPTSSR